VSADNESHTHPHEFALIADRDSSVRNKERSRKRRFENHIKGAFNFNVAAIKDHSKEIIERKLFFSFFLSVRKYCKDLLNKFICLLT